ncbi:MAG: EVE domain-containing protein [Candidatus Paceibacterota bacterium]
MKTVPKAPNYWLMKSEPESYGIDHLKYDKKTAWTGVRNFQARNYMQKDMRVGDIILFYHSSCKEPGVYGLAKVVTESYPDPTQFDSQGHYFEPRATKAKPIWYLVDIAYVETFKRPVLLPELRSNPQFARMMLLQPGSRLSITPVDSAHAEEIIRLAISISYSRTKEDRIS